jgi:hypothetical protein
LGNTLHHQLYYRLNTSFFFVCLEVKLGEEPLVLASLVLLLESLLDLLLSLFSLRWFLESVGGNNGLEGVEFESVTSWHEMVVVDDLDEWLNSSSLGNLLFAVLLGNLQRITFDTSDQSMSEWVGLGALVVWLDDDNLLTGVSTADNDSYMDC